MGKLVRFSVSLEEKLLGQFDGHLSRRGWASRSEALRDLIRQELVRQEWIEGDEVAGAVTLVYDHHRKDLLGRITDFEHDYQHLIVSSQHIHLDHDHCLEILAVKGRPAEIRRLAETLRMFKGVTHGTLSMSTTGKNKD